MLWAEQKRRTKKIGAPPERKRIAENTGTHYIRRVRKPGWVPLEYHKKLEQGVLTATSSSWFLYLCL
jgi:hypothetical protein